jgi:hypothetical protein
MIAWFNNNRKDKRMMRPITARFRICSDDDPSKPNCGWDIVTIKNLGEGGLFFHYIEKIQIGSKLEFNIALPHKGTWAHCTGRVCRVDEPSKDPNRRRPIYGIAANFTGLDEESYAQIKEAMERYAI